jgi:mannose-1-phosphate guanylyltransferase
VNGSSNFWAVILAAGEGSRLRSLTTRPDGTAIPKQFCSLLGSRSLLDDAIERAARVVPSQRICTIVAQEHQQWWSRDEALNVLRPGNVFVQPSNRGTAIGVLYSLLHIVKKDANALVVLLPADHYVDAESVLSLAMRAAMDRVVRSAEHAVLLGMQPDEPDSELGYIVPGVLDSNGGYTVMRFIEKPQPSEARDVIAQGGLWNTFILAASARMLLRLFLGRFASVVEEMQLLLNRYLASPSRDRTSLVDLYARLPQLDFSRDILEDRPASLCVVPVPLCGWNDLGTPRRVGRTLGRVNLEQTLADTVSCGHMTLAVEFHRRQLSGHLT